MKLALTSFDDRVGFRCPITKWEQVSREGREGCEEAEEISRSFFRSLRGLRATPPTAERRCARRNGKAISWARL
jgi:hypothetical protein